MMTTEIEIVHLQVGKPVPRMLQDKPVLSAIGKRAVTEPIYLDALNLAGDAQADLVHHGGPDRAVCAYAIENYALWEREYGKEFPLGAFGENVTLRGLVEDQVCIGDLFRWGEALLQVTMGRVPCSKIDMNAEAPGIARRFRETGLTGYFFRVLEEGLVSADHPFVQVERHPLGVTVAEVNRVIFHEMNNTEALKRMLEVEPLADAIQEMIRKRLASLA
jgi:MOSC domain-containing protein YiiM